MHFAERRLNFVAECKEKARGVEDSQVKIVIVPEGM